MLHTRTHRRAIAFALLLLIPHSAAAQEVPPAPGSAEAEAEAAQNAEAPDATEAGAEGATETDATEPAETPPAPETHREADLRAETGRLALRRGQLEEALTDLRRAYDLDPIPERRLELASVLEALRRESELAELYSGHLESEASLREAEVRARLRVLVERADAPAAPQEAPAEAEDDDDENNPFAFFEDPVFWIVAAVVVVALGASLIADATSGSGNPVPGDDGLVVQTLVEWP